MGRGWFAIALLGLVACGDAKEARYRDCLHNAGTGVTRLPRAEAERLCAEQADLSDS